MSTADSYSPTSLQDRSQDHACEREDNYPLGDSLEYNCIFRRLKLTSSVYSDMLIPDVTSGFSVQALPLLLRQMYLDLKRRQADVGSRIADLQRHIHTESNSTLVSASRALKKVLNEETLLAQSVNNAWMNLVNVTDRTSSAESGFQTLLLAVAKNLTSYFTQSQLIEETAGYLNLKRSVALFNEALTAVIGAVNERNSAVHFLFDMVNDNVEMTTDKTTVLGNSLQGAGDLIESKAGAFNTTGAQSVEDTGANLQRAVLKARRDYEATNRVALQSVQSGGRKRDLFVKSSEVAVSDQEKLVQNLLDQTRNSSNRAGDAVRASFYAAQPFRADLFDRVTTELADRVTNITGTSAQRADRLSANLSLTGDMMDAVSAAVGSVNHEAQTRMFDSESSLQAEKISATEDVAGVLGSDFAGHQTDVLREEKRFGEAAEDGVGTSSVAGLERMSSEFSEIGNSGADENLHASSKMHALASGLTRASQTALSGVAAASDEVGSQTGVVMNQVLGRLGEMRVPRVSADGLVGTMLESSGRDAEILAIASASTESSAAGAADVSTGVGSLAESLSSLEGTGDSTVREIQDLIDSANRGQTSAANGAFAADESMREILAEASQRVAMAESFLAQILGKGGVASGPNLAMSKNLFSAINDGSLESMQAEFDRSSDGQASQLGNSQESLESVQRGLFQTSKSGTENSVSAAGTLEQEVRNSVTEIDATAAQLVADTSAEVTTNLQSLQTLQTSQTSFFELSDSDMDEVRRLAASIDALNKQINSFLTASNPKLFGLIQKLPGLVSGHLGVNERGQSGLAGARELWTERRPGVEAGVAKLQSHLIGLNATALDLLQQPILAFNLSVSTLLANLDATLTQMVDKYVHRSEGVAPQLVSTTQAVVNEEMIGPVDPLQDLHSDVKAVFERAVAASSTNASSLSDLVPGGTIELTNLVAAASAEAAFFMKSLAANATALVKQAQTLNGTQEEANELSRIDAEANLSQKANDAVVGASGEQLKSLSAASVAVVTDYEESAKAAAAAKQNQASFVHDAIIAGQADTAKAIASLNSNFTIGQSNSTRRLDSDAVGLRVRMNQVRRLMQNLLHAYDVYLQSQEAEFAGEDAQRDNFMHSLALSVQQQLDAVKDGMTAQVGDISSQHSDLQTRQSQVLAGSSVEDGIGRIQKLVSSWADNTLETIEGEAAEISKISPASTNPSESQIQALVQQIAATAINSLQENGRTVPERLMEMAR